MMLCFATFGQAMIDVCSALVYMHSRSPPVVHGDLKSGNILMQRDGPLVHAKVLDFGLSRILARNARALGGTLRYMAPEVIVLLFSLFFILKNLKI